MQVCDFTSCMSSSLGSFLAKITSGNSCPQASSRSASIGSKRKARNGAYGEDTALTNARRDAFIAQRRFEAAEKAKERAKTVLEENPQGPGWAHKYGRTTVEKWIAKHQKAFENAQRAYVEAEKEYSEREKIHILYKGLRD